MGRPSVRFSVGGLFECGLEFWVWWDVGVDFEAGDLGEGGEGDVEVEFFLELDLNDLEELSVEESSFPDVVDVLWVGDGEGVFPVSFGEEVVGGVLPGGGFRSLGCWHGF